VSNKYRKNNAIDGQFNVRTIKLMESPAYRVLSRAGRMLLDRIGIELAHHGGNDNGKLIVTYDQFVDYGIHRHAIAPAIRETCALGFLEVTQKGRPSAGELRYTNLFRLPWAVCKSSPLGEQVNAWSKIPDMKTAAEIADAARKAVPTPRRRRAKTASTGRRRGASVMH
jgi:hypothetical protein